MPTRGAPRCGIVGPARTRIGLGPFLARELEAAGAQIVAVAGRDAGRARDAAAALSRDFEHPVAAFDALGSMLGAVELDALVIAAPIPVHLPALQAALQAKVATLCEKPLVAPEQHDLVPDLTRAFAERGLWLAENCLWPYTLGAFDQLHPGRRAAVARRFAMRLSPVGVGRDMLVDSLSHFVSMLQAVAPLDAATRLAEVRLEGAAPDSTRVVVHVVAEGGFGKLEAELWLETTTAQPRPAWFAIDGVRIDRAIDMADYEIRFAAGGAEIAAPDPLRLLVREFVEDVQQPDPQRLRDQTAAICTRGRLYAEILECWPGDR